MSAAPSCARSLFSHPIPRAFSGVHPCFAAQVLMPSRFHIVLGDKTELDRLMAMGLFITTTCRECTLAFWGQWRRHLRSSWQQWGGRRSVQRTEMNTNTAQSCWVAEPWEIEVNVKDELNLENLKPQGNGSQGSPYAHPVWLPVL